MSIPEMPAATAGESPKQRRKRWSQLLLFGPVALFLVLMLAFAMGLGHDPKLVPSPLIGKPVPVFSLPPVNGRRVGLSSVDLQGEISLVNVFASWRVACREEHPVLMQLAKQRTVPVHGLNYKDKPEEAALWLDGMGDPYTRTGADTDGRVAIDWGVYGVPETFVVDGRGRIAFKQVGPMTPEILDWTILPLVARLRADLPAGSGGDR